MLKLKDKIIIHLSGLSGSGKSTTGLKLKHYFGDSIEIIELNQSIGEFVFKTYNVNDKWLKICLNSYKHDNFQYKVQKYITNLILNSEKKIILICGINYEPLIEKKFYNLHSKYNFYIYTNPINAFIGYWSRQKYISTGIFLLNLIPSLLIYYIFNFLLIRKYKQYKYYFISRDKIYKVLLKLIKNKIKNV